MELKLVFFLWANTDSPSRESKRRKVEDRENYTAPDSKKFNFNTNPNLQNSLVQKYIGNWKKQKQREKFATKFMAQYRSQFEWMSAPHVKQFYREGGRNLNVCTDLTEYGCGPTLKRYWRCWCTTELNRKKKEEQVKENAAKQKEKLERMRMMAAKVNKSIQEQNSSKTTTTTPAKATKTSRWGAWIIISLFCAYLETGSAFGTHFPCIFI